MLKREAATGGRVRAESIAWLDLAITMHMLSKRFCFHACVRQPRPPLFFSSLRRRAYSGLIC